MKSRRNRTCTVPCRIKVSTHQAVEAEELAADDVDFISSVSRAFIFLEHFFI
jgi:hypothetical protein